MSKPWKVARVAFGVVLIAIGLLGMLLPVMPGLPVLVAGLALIGLDHPLVRPFADRLRRWHLLPKRKADSERR